MLHLLSQNIIALVANQAHLHVFLLKPLKIALLPPKEALKSSVFFIEPRKTQPLRQLIRLLPDYQLLL